MVECAYVEGDGEYARFFSQPLLLGKEGIAERRAIGTLSDFEQKALEGMLDTLKKIFSWAKSSLNKLTTAVKGSRKAPFCICSGQPCAGYS